MKEYRERGICVEVCPISNQILGYVDDLQHHPASTLLNAEVPGGMEGGHRAALLYSLVQSCRLVEIDPFAYTRDVLMRIATPSQSRIKELTPKAWAERVRLAGSRLRSRRPVNTLSFDRLQSHRRAPSEDPPSALSKNDPPLLCRSDPAGRGVCPTMSWCGNGHVDIVDGGSPRTTE